MKITLAETTKSYGRTKALDHVSLEISSGKIVAVLGENGAGKSTLLQLLAGVLVPSNGAILYDGELFQRRRIDLRKQLHFLPDFPVFFGGTTVLTHLAMMLDLYERDTPEVRAQVTQLLETLDLITQIEVDLGDLSRGQLYKVALVGLIAARPKLWLLDEPFASGMDPKGLRVFREEAQRAAAEGATILFSSQILAAAEQLATDVLVLADGKVKVFSPLDQLRREMSGNADLEAIFSKLTA